MAVYKPLMSKKEIEKRKIWQEKVYQKLKAINKKNKINVLGKEILILPGIFAPFWGDSLLLPTAVLKETKKDDYVLDLGSGTGVQGIFAAKKASKVISIDINPVAVKCARLNAKNLKLSDKITVFKSDLFSNIKDKFDLIIFNPPFRWFKPRDILERGSLDENYKTLRKFFREVKKYLKNNGRILLVFSNSGDIDYLKFLIKLHRFEHKIIARHKSNGWDYIIYKLTIS